MPRRGAAFRFFLAFPLLMLAFFWVYPDDATAKGESKITLKVVYADKETEQTDKRLGALGDQLKELFDFTNYSLLSNTSKTAKNKTTVTFDLPDDRKFIVAGLGKDEEGRIKISVEIPELIKTDFRIEEEGALIIGGPKHDKGVILLILSIEGN